MQPGEPAADVSRELKALFRDQYLLLHLDEERAVARHPLAAARRSREQRREACATIRGIIEARGAPGDATRRTPRCSASQQLFGLGASWSTLTRERAMA